jgi:hypothetical protein
MVLFLSDYRGQASTDFITDCSFTVSGAQTNEAPTQYAIKRLQDEGQQLNHVIALVTPKAKETALEKYQATLAETSPTTTLIEVEIEDTASSTEILQRTLNKLLPMNPEDHIILDTTGGFRHNVTDLVLLARFLRYSGRQVEFSIYSEYHRKYVSDTSETDGLFELLDAVNKFAETGNAGGIGEVFPEPQPAALTYFFRAAKQFHQEMILCRRGSIEQTIASLKAAIEALEQAKYETENPKMLVFQKIVQPVIREKMTFLAADAPNAMLLAFIQWCNDNWYLQQAVTFLKEYVCPNRCHEDKGIFFLSDQSDNIKLYILRNSVNHGGEAKNTRGWIKEQATSDMVDAVQAMLCDLDTMRDFVNGLLQEIREGLPCRVSPPTILRADG